MNRPNNIPFEEYKTSPCLEDRRIIQYIELLENKVKNLGVLADVSGSLLATEVDPVEKWDNGAPMYICPNCKEAELGHGDKYCPNCGQSEQLVCQCKEPDIWMKVYEGLMCLNCMKPPKAK